MREKLQMYEGVCLGSLREAKELHLCVQVSRRLDPLPAGFFYDGRQYVDVFGEKRSLHPSILPHASHTRV